jgi:ketosteroid isomerase-like protein
LANWLISSLANSLYLQDIFIGKILKVNSLKRIILLVISIHASACLFAQPPLTKDQQAVQQTLVSFFEALSNRDSVSLKKYATADIALFEYGSIWTIDTLIRKAITLNTSKDFKRSNAFEFISTKVNANTAWVSYRLRSDISSDGRKTILRWLESVVAVREKGLWKIALLHSTLIKRE